MAAVLAMVCLAPVRLLAEDAPDHLLAEGAIAEIDKIAQEGIAAKKVASFGVGVVRDGRLVLARGYGMADLENQVPATAETVYRLGSITKQFTAVAIMLLAEEGKLSVDDELTKFLPDYPTHGKKITLRHLLQHTSGIKSYTSLENFPKIARNDYSHDELIGLFKNMPLEFEPGTKWNYSNSGYYLLGMVIEKASSQKYEEFLAERIFRPLGMSDTRYGHLQPLIPRRAMGYRNSLEGLVNDDFISMDAPYAAGALVSTVLDLVKWSQALDSGALLSSESYAAMYERTKLENDSTRPYGFGWQLGELAGHKSIGHGGGIPGFSTMITRYPEDRLSVIVLSNTSTANSGEVAKRIARVMLGVQEEPQQPIEDKPIDAALAEQLVGKYKLEEADAVIEVSADEGKLFGSVNGRPKERLKFQGEREFVVDNDDAPRVEFTPKEGKAAGVLVEAGDDRLEGKRVE
jgi:CubicO group peptidase (beta-lactamase class C family)